MLKNHFNIAWRNIRKNRTSSFINISGLAIGIAVALLTGLWLFDELSFNKYHESYDRIAKVCIRGVEKTHGPFLSPTLSYPLAETLREQYKGNFNRLIRTTRIDESILSAGPTNAVPLP